MAFTANLIIGAAPLLVLFTDTTTGSIKSWYWQFGDSETSTEQNPTHIYTAEGRYDVELEVTYDDDSTEIFTELEYILVDEVQLEAAIKCLRFATEQNEGYGWSEFGGDDMVIPMDVHGAFTIKDDNGQNRDIVVDDDTFEIYEIDTCDRYTNTDASPLDKETTEITAEKWEREETLSSVDEDKRIKHENSYIGIRPDDTNHRGAAGYGETGLRNAQQIDLEAYTNGEKIAPSAKAKKVVEYGRTIFTAMNVNDNRVQMVVKLATGQIHVASHVHNYLAIEGSPTPSLRLPGDYDIIKELSTGKVLWLTRGGLNPLYNRCTHETLSGGTVTTIEGPDGRDGAFECTEDITCDNAAVTTESTIVMWSKSATPIAGIGSWTAYSVAVDGWTMYYIRLTTGMAAGLVIIAGSRFDVRFYNKRLSSGAIAELYDNVVNYQGKKVLP